MRKWLYDNPWIWVALFLAALVAGSMITLVIAQINRPEIVKERRAAARTSLFSEERQAPTLSLISAA